MLHVLETCLRPLWPSPIGSLPSHPIRSQAENQRLSQSTWTQRLGNELADARAAEQEARRCRAGPVEVMACPGVLQGINSIYINHDSLLLSSRELGKLGEWDDYQLS